MGPPELVLRPACAFSWQFSFPSTTEASRGKQGLQSARQSFLMPGLWQPPLESDCTASPLLWYLSGFIQCEQ